MLRLTASTILYKLNHRHLHKTHTTPPKKKNYNIIKHGCTAKRQQRVEDIAVVMFWLRKELKQQTRKGQQSVTSICWSVTGPRHPAGVDQPERAAGRRDRVRQDSSLPASRSSRDNEVARHHTGPQTELSSRSDTGAWPRAGLPDSGLY